MNAAPQVSPPYSAAAGTSGVRHSAVYEGWVRHRRHAPRPHAFRYKVALLYLDLAELEHVFAGRWLWSRERGNLASFHRADYLGPAELPLDEAVRRCASAALGRRPSGPIRLLTHPRYAGHAFNPVSFYYCYQADGETLDCIVAEITNTPWKERHSYVLDVDTAKRQHDDLSWRFDKQFHVSPFMPMERRYDWRFNLPAEHLRVHMDVLRADGRDFDATLTLRRRPLNAGALARVLWRYPLMTWQVVAAIHWQALRLWLRGNPVHDHPPHREHESHE